MVGCSRTRTGPSAPFVTACSHGSNSSRSTRSRTQKRGSRPWRRDDHAPAPNAATLHFERFVTALLAADGDGLTAMCALDIEIEDRRPIVAAPLRGVDAVVENWMFLVGRAGHRFEWEPIATRGSRLAPRPRRVRRRRHGARPVCRGRAHGRRGAVPAPRGVLGRRRGRGVRGARCPRHSISPAKQASS